MRRARYTDWTASVEDGYHLLRSVTDRVYLAGLSMGGVLSLLMSTRLDVEGVIAMSTPYQLPQDYPLWLLKLYGTFFRYNPKSDKKPGISWFDKAAEAVHISYPQNPIRSAAELKSLLNDMQAALPDVRKPVLLIHSKDDPSVPCDDMEKIYAGLINNQDRTKILITGSGHVITRDAARRQVFESALEFLDGLEKS
jgi:carboxylesterase